MNGAEDLLRALADAGVRVCFTNPGTTELHIVGALERVPQIRPVLALFEGVVTGAADGYARIAGIPAATLLHLGPGLANGLANLHNARRARSPIINVVGDHATYHKQYDPPLESDIPALISWLDGPMHRPERVSAVRPAADAVVAAATAPPGHIATVVMPEDVSWSSDGAGGGSGRPLPERSAPAAVDPSVITEVADVLRGGEPAALIIGGVACRASGLYATSRIAAACGARAFTELNPSLIEHGAGLPTFDRLGLYPEQVVAQLDGARHVILAGTPAPVSFFAYPGQPSYLIPDGAQTHVLAEPGQDVAAALTDLADRIAPGTEPPVSPAGRPALPSGPLTLNSWPEVVAALLPENAIVCDETVSSGVALPAATAGAPRHDVLTQTGGSMGLGLPLSIGAAVAAPNRPVIALEAEGCALYTISALWTQARENLDITTVILNNRSYAVLREEWSHLNPAASDPDDNPLLELSGPDIDFVALAAGFGVPASHASTADDLAEQLRHALAEPGPHLIEALIPPVA